jgi:hypothetical protein
MGEDPSKASSTRFGELWSSIKTTATNKGPGMAASFLNQACVGTCEIFSSQRVTETDFGEGYKQNKTKQCKTMCENLDAFFKDWDTRKV